MVEQLAVNQLVAGSNPAAGAIASLAQSVERIHGKDEVAGSSPAGSFYVEHGPLVKWLRHRPFTAVTRVRIPYGSYNRRISSAGRAPALQAGGRRFKSCILHHLCRPSSTGRATDL